METFRFKSINFFAALAVTFASLTFCKTAFGQDVMQDSLATEVISSPCFGEGIGPFTRKRNDSNSVSILFRRKVAADDGPLKAKNGWPLDRSVEISDIELNQLLLAATREHLTVDEASELVRLCGRNGEVMKSFLQKSSAMRLNQVLKSASQSTPMASEQFHQIVERFANKTIEFTQAEKEVSKEFSDSKLAVAAYEKITRRVKPQVSTLLEEIAKNRGKDDIAVAAGLSPEARKRMLEGN